MNKGILILFSTLIFSTIAYAQQQFTEKFNNFNEVIETNNPDYNSYAATNGLRVEPVKWVPYTTDCKQCQRLAKQYNDAMQDLFDVRGLLSSWEGSKAMMDKNNEDARKVRDAIDELNKSLPNVTVAEPEPLSEEEAAAELNRAMFIAEFNNHIPILREARDKLELTTKNLRKALTECEVQCVAPEERKNLISLPPNTIDRDPELPFNWNGPYYEVCEACRKLAARLNELYDIGIDNVNEMNAINAKLAYIRANITVLEASAPGNVDSKRNSNQLKTIIRDLKSLRSDLKDAENEQKRILKNQEKIIKNFNDTLEKYNECIRQCPPQKNACVFPDELFESMTIGPNNEVGSSAQAAKELRDKVTGAAKGAATKAIGNLIGFGGFGGGGSGGPKIDKDRTRGDFTRISSGDTDLDIRASWKDDQLIVSTEIDNSPDNGTFHAQWIEDKDGNTYLPVRFMIFEMYRDWKLTVSWTEDHYVDGEHVFHDEGKEISTGRDLLGTWSIFEGAKGIANSIWGMLGFDTAAKGVKHLGAVYNIPPASFPDDCQMQLVTHISQPSLDPVTTLPIVGDLFKHVDESRRKPETIILVQPHLLKEEDLE